MRQEAKEIRTEAPRTVVSDEEEIKSGRWASMDSADQYGSLLSHLSSRALSTTLVVQRALILKI